MASKPEQEPSIEEILASIRQIISDDDQPREGADLTQEPEEKFEIPVAEPVKEEEPPVSSFASVLDLTNEIPPDEPEVVTPPEREAEIDLGFGASAADVDDIMLSTPAAQEPEKVTPFPANPPHAPLDAVESIFTQTAAEATSAAFAKLIGNIPVEREENTTLYANGRITLEDIVKDMLRPMLRDWVNTHVPQMVERLVEKELEKLTKSLK